MNVGEIFMGRNIKRKYLIVVTLVISLLLIVPISPGILIPKISSFQKQGASVNRGIRSDYFTEDFESYEYFSLIFPPWLNIDVDGSPTFGHYSYDWPTENLPQAFIIFNPSRTDPPWTGLQIEPHNGEQFAACFADNNQDLQNDDWLITPQLWGDFSFVDFWAKSYSNQYNLERFEVGVSTTNTSPSSFTIISPTPYVVPPYESWTEYKYFIDNYMGMKIYIGIHCVSHDSWLLMIDDFRVSGGEDDHPPVTTCELTGEKNGDIFVSDVHVTMNATDYWSGVKATYYKLDKGSWKTYVAPFNVSTDGQHTLQYYSQDVHDWAEDPKTVNFTIMHLKINMTGGFGVTTTLKNTGVGDLNGISWGITFQGGLILIGPKNGITDVPAGKTINIRSFVLGFGNEVAIKVNAGYFSVNATGKIFLFFVTL